MGVLPFAIMCAIYYFFASIVSGIKYANIKNKAVPALVFFLKQEAPKYKDKKQTKLISTDYTYELRFPSDDGKLVIVDYVETVANGYQSEYKVGDELNVIWEPGMTQVKALNDVKKKMTTNVTSFFISVAVIIGCILLLMVLEG